MRAAAIGVVVIALAGCDVVFGLDRAPPKPDAPIPAERWATAAGGYFHTCGIRLDHTLWCWGRNDAAQLGARSGFADWEVEEPRQVGADADWEQLSARNANTCAIKTDRRLFCWGDNSYGELATGDRLPVDKPVQIAGAWSRVAVGVAHVCAIDGDGQLWCWGDNSYGELGIGSATGAVTTPTLVAGPGTWTDVGAGGFHTCALRADDRAIWCWGSNPYGQVGVPGVNPVNTPASTGTAAYTKLVVLEYATCGLEPAGTVKCWGLNTRGQVGDGSGMARDRPTPVGQDQITDFVDLAAGLAHACALRAGGELWCWGDNERGELADGEHAFRTVPTVVAGTWSAIAGMGDHATCVLDAEHRLSCAGFGPAGGLGTGTGSERSPRQLPGAYDQLSAGWGTSCGRSGTSISCWGSNRHGSVGDTTLEDRQVPVALSGVWGSVVVSDHTCALDDAQHLWCWGANDQGQLGQRDQTEKTQPTLVGDLTAKWVTAALTFHTAAIDLNGSIYEWGANNYGQAGFSALATPIVYTPQRPQAIVWKAVTAGDYHTCGITAGNSVQCWGWNGEGELGIGTTPVQTEVPQTVAVPGNPLPDAISAGERFTCLRAGTAVWCWGGNAFGQLGNQTTLPSPMPVRLPGVWNEIAAGQWHACGIKSDGSLWCWGQNHWGQLGIGTMFEQHEPLKVGMDLDWRSVTAGATHTCATKTTGTVWCWGSNINGELGSGTAWRATFEEITK